MFDVYININNVSTNRGTVGPGGQCTPTIWSGGETMMFDHTFHAQMDGWFTALRHSMYKNVTIHLQVNAPKCIMAESI